MLLLLFFSQKKIIDPVLESDMQTPFPLPSKSGQKNVVPKDSQSSETYAKKFDLLQFFFSVSGT